MENSERTDYVLELSSKTWNRVTDAATKTGYREGIEVGKQSTFQEGFDRGYEEAFKTAFALGRYKGLATALPKDLKHPPEIEAILDKTRRGACPICPSETRTRGKNKDWNEKPLETIVDDHKKHSAKIIGTLHEYFEPLLKEHGIDIS